MKILLLGSGGREHAFALELAESPLVDALWISPGNAGTSECGENIQLSDFDDMYRFAVENGVDLVVPASEDPLVAGITDHFQQLNARNQTSIRVVGPVAAAARLEGSKDYSKAFMLRHGIPTARAFTTHAGNLEEGLDFLKTMSPPYVLKADGLAAGKGVVITPDLDEAESILKEMILARIFGDASERVVIEEYLHGIEISVFAVSDGQTWQFLGSAKDYKRIGEGDTGPNTGGMGAISPVPFADDDFMEKVRQNIAEPTFRGLISEGSPFCGFLFIGLMNCDGEPYVIEYNVRMGDPETEAIFPRLKTDLAELLSAMASGNLEQVKLEMSAEFSATVFVVSKGYPGPFEKNKVISVPEPKENERLYHAGTKDTGGHICTNGGRVMAANALAPGLDSAIQKAISLAGEIRFEGATFRRDIGYDLLQMKNN